MHFRPHIAPLLLLATCFHIPSTSAEERAEPAPLRRPLVVHPLASGQIVVANRCGSLMLVDGNSASSQANRILCESQIADQLSDLHPLSDTTFLATDEARHRLLRIELSENQFRVVADFPVPPYPVSVRTSRDRTLISVASLWSRQLTLLHCDVSTNVVNATTTVDLAFAPRSQIFLPGDRELLVCDAFGGRLAIVEVSSGKIITERATSGHAVRGLIPDVNGKFLIAAHSVLNPYAHGNQSDMHWGLLVSNDIRWLDPESVRNPERPAYAGGRVIPLGLPGRGRGDPAGVAMREDGLVAACAAGTQEVLIGNRDDDSLTAVKVGRRPTAVAFSRDGSQVIVANTFDDSLSIIDTKSLRIVSEIALAPARERSLIERGEEIFFDARLSHEGWLSCHSCHVDGHSSFKLNDNLSDGGFGAPKLVLSLLGRRGTAPFAWNASVASLGEQVQSSIEKTMQSDHPPLSSGERAAVVAFIESLPAPPSVDRLRGRVDEAAIARGSKIFVQRECTQCHAPPTYTVVRTEDVDLTDEMQQRHFNPPSLKGISQRDAFLHDGRATSLADVFLRHGHPGNARWEADQVADLVAFLRSL